MSLMSWSAAVQTQRAVGERSLSGRAARAAVPPPRRRLGLGCEGAAGSAARVGFYEFHARNGVEVARALVDERRMGRGNFKPFLHGMRRGRLSALGAHQGALPSALQPLATRRPPTGRAVRR
jgi:hypothetical protein